MLVRDIETRSVVDLARVGPLIYATHPSTEVLCVGYCRDDGPVKIWRPGNKVPYEYRDPPWAVAHAATFEMLIERHILGPKYGFPVPPLDRNVCTMAIANALALPASLDKLAKVLNLPHQKDMNGQRVMLQASKPRRPRKHEDRNGVYFFDDAERLEQVCKYCINDVEATRDVVNVLPWLSDDEYELWILDHIINDRGFHVDIELAQAARHIADEAKPRIDNAINKLTNGRVATVNQVAKLKEWLTQYVDIKSLNKRDLAQLLEQEIPWPARQALLLREQGAQAAVKKVDALLQHRNGDGRLHHAFVYHAAGTGRWASRGAQVHNLKRPNVEDLEHAIEVISRGSLDHAREMYETPLSVIGDLVRAMICAAPGHMLIGGDFSGIEARVTAWLANEQSKLDIFRKYDTGEGPDPYIVAAAKIFDVPAQSIVDGIKQESPQAREQRQVGKASELAFSFGGSIGAYRRFAPDTPMSDFEIDRVKQAWRQAHPNIVKLWHDLYKGALFALRKPGTVVSCSHERVRFESDSQPFLWMTLPSCRRLAYPHARMARVIVKGGKVIETVAGDPSIICKDNSSGQWRDVRLWYGTLVENVTQAVARDLLAAAMIRIEKAGFPIVTHVHDEIVIEVPEDQATKIKPRFAALMAQAPHWAEGLPIAVKPWVGKRYLK